MTRKILTLTEISETTRVPVNTLRYWHYQQLNGPRLWKLGAKLVAYEDDIQSWLDELYESTSTKTPA